MGRKTKEDYIRRTKKTKDKEKKNRNGGYNKKHVRQMEKVIEKYERERSKQKKNNKLI